MNICAIDLSSNYKKFIPNGSSIHKLKNVTVVLIPGILAETVMKDSPQRIKLSFALGDYFKNFVDFFNENKIKNQLIFLESENGVTKNSQDLKRKLENIPGEIFIISHSKGSLEFLDVLLNDKEEKIKSRLHSWLSIQSPFYGSSLADLFSDTPIVKNFSSLVFDFLGGDKDGIISLKTQVRRKYMLENQDKIAKLMGEINTIQYLTYIEDKSGIDTVLELSRDYLFRKSQQNDGMVEISNAIIKDGNYIIEEGIDHLSPVLKVKLKRQEWNPQKIIEFTLNLQ